VHNQRSAGWNCLDNATQPRLVDALRQWQYSLFAEVHDKHRVFGRQNPKFPHLAPTFTASLMSIRRPPGDWLTMYEYT
jgi:hypothetical protein